MTDKRFRVVDIEEELYPMPIYYDDGRELGYNEVCVLLNDLHNKNEKLLEDYHQVMVQKELLKCKLEKYEKLMQKYGIKSVELLDKMLMERTVW